MRGIVPTEMKETADDEQNLADDACKRIPPPFANCTKRAQGPRPARRPSSLPLLVVVIAVA